MDGKLLLRELRDLLNEQDNSSWFNDFTGYNYLFQAAIEFVGRTNCLHGEATITTVANQQTYDLPADFLQLYVRDDNNTHVVKYYNTSSYQMIPYRSYERVYYEDQTTAQSIPNYFSIMDSQLTRQSALRVTGTSTFAGASVGGAVLVADTTSRLCHVCLTGILFTTPRTVPTGWFWSSRAQRRICHGDVWWHKQRLECWRWLCDSAERRYQLVLDPKPLTSGHTVYVPYTQRPVPVFSDYGIYRFPDRVFPAIVKYAFWLYKYRDSQPKVGDAMYQYFDQATKRWGSGISERLREMSRFRVNLRAR